MRRLTKCFKCTTVILYIGFFKKKSKCFCIESSVGAIADHNHYPVCEKGRGELKKKLGKEGKLVGVSTTPSTRNNNGCVIIARSFFSAADYLGD